jgi:hypothetical protein
MWSFRGRLGEVRRCFDGSGEGRVRLTWQVGANGQVTETSIESSTLGAPDVERCLSAFVSDLRFDRRQADAKASWTFVHGVADESVLERAKRGARDTAQARNEGVVVDPSSPGRLAVQQIESVAENGFKLYAFCMREGLHRNMRLSGRVRLRFTIDPNGRVRDVNDAGSDLGDLEVIDCVAEAFYAMRFPEPEGGSVHLEYSLLLNED